MSSEYEQRYNLPHDMRDGVAANFRIRIDSFCVQDAAPIHLSAPGVSLIVGGNNAGKSTLLRQMYEKLTSDATSGHLSKPNLLSAMSVQLSPAVADAHAWLAENSHTSDQGYQLARGGAIHPSDITAAYTYGRPGQLGAFGKLLALAPNARTRFAAVAPSDRRPDFTSPPTTDLHQFEDDASLLEELNEYTGEIFGTRLTLDQLSGQLILRFGVPSIPAPPLDAITESYRSALGQLNPISSQGDGVASTLGLLIPLIAGRTPIAFVDEPEAYLHPPQAYKLGQVLARISKRRRVQIIIATHDKNLVAGVLAEDGEQCTLIRLSRSESSTVAHKVDPELLSSVWSSALLRHSNVLDGLFHRAVVIAENERDCVFYASALEECESLPEGLLPNDILFVSSHGKNGVPELASVLTSAKVPVVVALDLDALNNEDTMRRLAASVGSDWNAELSRQYTLATAEFKIPRRVSSNGQILRQVTSILEEAPEADYVSATRREIQAVLAIQSPWQELKKYGVVAFRADRAAADALLALLAKIGLMMVPVGELEGFAPSLPVGKGAAWLPAALAANAHQDELAQRFALEIAAAVVSRETDLSVS